MTIDNMAYDMIENVQLDMNQYNDFLRMMDDYKAQLYMDFLNKENQKSVDVSDNEDDLPFLMVRWSRE
jgi:hypothetical protein